MTGRHCIDHVRHKYFTYMLYTRNIIYILVIILGIVLGIIRSIIYSIYIVLPAIRIYLPIYLPGMVNSRVLLLIKLGTNKCLMSLQIHLTKW
jgi:hypothetical protein